MFDGQQEGERILFVIHPHPTVTQLAAIKIILVAALFVVIGIITALLIPGLLIGIIVAIAGLWWSKKHERDSKTYITDRRIMRFERVSPFQVAKRALFWTETLKAKSYQPNLILQKLHVGTLIIEPSVPADENIVVAHVHYADDLANYIDKILFTFKNNPGQVASIKPFIPKPRGQRD